MRCKLIISLFCCCVFNIAVNAQTTPGIRQVVRTFYSHYNLSAFTVQQVQFQKRKDDWYIATIEYNGGKMHYNTPILFYSGKQKKFLDLEIDRNGSQRAVDVSSYLLDYQILNFDIQPYYGYPGSYLDAIKDLSSRPELSEDDLYALARAYSTATHSSIGSPNDDVAPGKFLQLPFNEQPLAGAALDEYKRNADSAIAYFGRLAKRNSRYKTAVGSIGRKYANEIVDKYHMLLMLAPTDAEQMTLPDGIYEKKVEDSARMILKDCPPGAIFVSTNDNDLYPLLYIQKKENYRKDVYITNYVLMMYPPFIYSYTRKQLDASPIKLILDTSDYHFEVNELLYFAEGTATISSNEFFDILKMPLPPGESHHRLPIEAIRFHFKNPLFFSLSNINLMYRNGIIFMDILAHLEGRPLSMSGTLPDELRQMNERFKKDGMVRIFQP